MSSVTNLVPKIEGFQPIPNAVMIPFMETQSAALAFGFGLNYEYGKRTIRSMSNEKFNSLTSEQVAEMSAAHSTILLNRFILAVPQVMPAQIEIFKQYVEIEKAKVLQNVELAKWIATNAPSIITQGTTAGTNIKTTAPTPEPDRTSRAPPPITPKSTNINSAITLYVWYTGQVTEARLKQFMTRAYPSATVTSIRYAGTIITKNSGKGTRKQTWLITYSNAFPLVKTLTLTHNNYVDI